MEEQWSKPAKEAVATHNHSGFRHSRKRVHSIQRWHYLHAKAPNRDREKPRGSRPPTPPDVRVTYPAVRELNSYRGARLGGPKLMKKRNGSANANAAIFDNRHGPWVDLLMLAASRTDQFRGRLLLFSLPSALHNLAIGLSPTKQRTMPGAHVEVTGTARHHRAAWPASQGYPAQRRAWTETPTKRDKDQRTAR